MFEQWFAGQTSAHSLNLMRSPERSNLSCTLRFLLAWMLVPTFFRLLGFVGMMSRLDTLWRVLYVGSWTMAAGVPQDLFVALQCLLVMTLLNALLWRVGE